MAETAYACFYNGKLLPPNDEGAADGHCCLCCYFKQTIKPPDYTPFPEAPWEKNPNAGGEPNFKGCYCTCCPCWPDSSLRFEMKETAVSFDDGATFIPAVAENWDHTLSHGNSAGAGAHCFTTQYHGLKKAGVRIGEGAMWRCGSAAGGGGEYEDACVPAAAALRNDWMPYLNPEDVGFLDDCTKYGNDKLYPEAWGYRGTVCGDSHYRSTRPALITESPGNDTDGCGGMGIISTLCCCKTGGGADPDQPEGVALPDCYNRCPLEGGGPYCPGMTPEYGNQWSHLGSLDETVLSPAGSQGTWKHNYQDNYTCESHCFSYCLMPDPIYDMRFRHQAYFNWKGQDCDPALPNGTVTWVQDAAFHNTQSTRTPASRCVHKSLDIHPQRDYTPPDPTTAGFQNNPPGPYCPEGKPNGTNVYVGGGPEPKYNYNADYHYRYTVGGFDPQTPDANGKFDRSGHTKIVHAQCGGGDGGKFAIKVAGQCEIHADCQTGVLPCYDTSSTSCAPKQSSSVVCPPCGTLADPGPHDCCRGEAAGGAPLPDGETNIFKSNITAVFFKDLPPDETDPAVCEPTHFFSLNWPHPTPAPVLGSLIGMTVHNKGRGWIEPNGRFQIIDGQQVFFDVLRQNAGNTNGIAWLREENSWAEITNHTNFRDPGSKSIKIETTALTSSIREADPGPGDPKNKYCTNDVIDIYNPNAFCNHGFKNVKGLCWPSSDKFLGTVIMRWTGVIEEM